MQKLFVIVLIPALDSMEQCLPYLTIRCLQVPPASEEVVGWRVL